MTRTRRRKTFRGTNFLAFLVACTTTGILHIHSDPVAIGGSPSEETVESGMPLLNLPPTPLLPEPISGDAVALRDEQPKADYPQQIDPHVLRGIWALKFVSDKLRSGSESFKNVPDYTASFFKQERMNGVLGDPQMIDLKMKHEPFSVYMKWKEGDARGQQAIYVEGQNNSKLLVQPGGLKGRLTGTLKLDPKGSMAMSQSRHPVTKVGIAQLAKTILQYQTADMKRGDGFQCELRDDQTFEDRPCYLFTCVYESPEINPRYRKSVIFVDKELSMPVCVKNFTWAKDANPDKLDEETLAEFYAYTKIDLQKPLDEVDFNATNRKYRMRVR